ncbi:MAG: DUF1579 domain-containing protein [Methanococcaceae archaeon]
MKVLTSVLMTIIILIVLSLKISAQEKDMAAQQKAWMEYMTPGPAHNWMAESAGEWKTAIKLWMDPAAPPTVSEGSCKQEMILGGRYLKSTHTSTMMGMAYEGLMLQGFDNKTKEFTSIWMDNFGTGTMVSKGKYDQNNKTLTLNGTAVDPLSDKDAAYKQTLKIIDKNKMVMEMFMVNDGKETKTMEVEYTR